jgi:D-beta-D-heptose 7-phosphate kinase/D-beta-D-heptose 1-phosphate adenosyltransferase
VGINSDRSVKLLKGEDRPINKLDHRSKVLSSLKCVDKVVVFNDETPLNLIKAIKPDVLVKGGDYKVKEIVGYKEVIAHEGTVVTIDLVEGLSTSKIISKLA